MSQGRGSASINIITLISLLCLLVLAERANAATYTVGGPGGWTFNTNTWPDGKKFKAGDVLSKFKFNFWKKLICNFNCTCPRDNLLINCYL